MYQSYNMYLSWFVRLFFRSYRLTQVTQNEELSMIKKIGLIKITQCFCNICCGVGTAYSLSSLFFYVTRDVNTKKLFALSVWPCYDCWAHCYANGPAKHKEMIRTIHEPRT